MCRSNSGGGVAIAAVHEFDETERKELTRAYLTVDEGEAKSFV